MRKGLALAMALALFAASLSSAAAAPAGQADYEATDDCIVFAGRDYSVCFGFKSYWEQFGGLAVFGYPITGEMVDPAQGVTVQYFERARFEWHPGAWPERYDVLLGRLGAELTEARVGEAPFAPVQNAPDPNACTYFPATGHNLCAGFRAYWEHFGGLAIYGMPISEEFDENGTRVQYFERARFEWHRGVWPERYDVLLGLLGSEVLQKQQDFSVIATGLNNPRGLLLGPDGALYVSEAGLGGEDPCLPNPEGEGEVCYGATGAITRISDSGQERIVEGLPSLAAPGGGGAIGPQGISAQGADALYAVIGLGANPAARDDLGDAGAGFGQLIQITPDGQWTNVADIAAYETSANPDGGNIDSNPYAVLDLGDKRIVADAGGNDLLEVAEDGTITTLAVFPSRMVDAPPFLNMPPGSKIPMEAVPTSVVLGPDGAYYVGELTGFPFQVGAARIWRVVPGEEPDVFATGFTNIMDLAFGPDGSLYVLELAVNGLLAAEQGGDAFGAVIKIAPDGSRRTVAMAGLVMPTRLAVDDDGVLYVTNFGVMPGMGQVLKMTP